jgi:menaquinone-9 beta-reductase
MTQLETPICIVGAGPAGSTTSLFLSKFKIPHIIVDAKKFPRDKICGDNLDVKVMRVLNTLEPGLVEREIFNNPNFTKINGIVFHKKNNKQGLFELKPNDTSKNFPYFYSSPRNYFDNFLAEKIDTTYAKFLQNTLVTTIYNSNKKKVIVAKQNNEEICITANIIIGADGDHSVVLKHLQERSIDRVNYAAGLRQYWQGIAPIHPTTNCIELYFPKVLPMAYLWIFPLPNGMSNVGCGLGSKIVADKKVNLKKLFQEIITTDEVIKHRFENAQPIEKPQGWGLPFASLGRKPVGNGYLLVGDAASIISPVTGEGIGPAMLSGCIAAHFLQRAYQNNNYAVDMFTHYDREIYKHLKNDINFFNLLSKPFPKLHLWFFNNVPTSAFCQKMFQKHIPQWINTAMTKPLLVKMD